MRKRVAFPALVAATTAAIMVVLPAPAWACSCYPPEPQAELFRAAEVVFIGHMIDGPTPREIGAQPEGTVSFRFAVESSQKGSARDEITATTAAGNGSCGIAFERNERYQVFGSGDATEVSSHVCGGTVGLSWGEAYFPAGLARTASEPSPALAVFGVSLLALGYAVRSAAVRLA